MIQVRPTNSPSPWAARRAALVEQLHHVDGKAEIVRGEIERMSAAGDSHSRASGAIYFRLRQYEDEHGGGRAYADNCGFLADLPERWSFSPDAAWYTGEPGGEEFLPSPPVFAVEIRSKDEYGEAVETRMREKRSDYFAAGTIVVWDVDLFRDRCVHVFRCDAPDEQETFSRGEIANAEPAVPGWTLAVDELLRL
jgi:Uma2 family endonuclease